MKTNTGYGKLLRDTRFEAFLWTQFLGAFNDNVYKMIVSIVAVRIAGSADAGSRYLAIAGAVFVIPFLLFAGYAGQLADRFSKTRVLQIAKSLEIFTMLFGIAALVSGRLDFLLIVLFLLATQANFFSPAKYGILPEMMRDGELSRANGLLELTTFVAIVIGASFGALLFERWQQRPIAIGVILLGIAIIGTVTSLHIRRVPAAGSTETFRWNPLHEILQGAKELRRNRSLALTVFGLSWFWFIGALLQLALILAGREVFHVPEAAAGLLVTALAIGIAVGSVIAGAVSGDRIELGLVPFGAFLMGVFAVLLGLTSNYHHALLWLAGLGAAAGLFAVPLNAWLQEKAGAAEKGRILATNNFANMLGVVAASGVLWLLHDVARWNAGIILLASGVAMLAGALVTLAFMPLAAIRFLLRCLVNTLVNVTVEGEENVPSRGGALLVANHLSYLDSIFVGLTTNRTIRFLMKRAYYELPVANYLFRVLKAIPVQSGSPRTTALALRDARAVLEQDHLVAIFPEGRIALDGETAEFKRGFERIAGGTGLPVIPVRIEGIYGHPLSCKGGEAFRSWDRVWRPRIRIRVGAPIRGVVTPDELRQAVLAA